MNRLSIVVLALFPLAVFAQDVQASASGPWWVPLVLGFFGILSTVITTVLLPAWKRKVDAQVASEDAIGKRSLMTTVALKFEHFAEIVKANIDATMAPAIATALADGVITPEETAGLRKLALEQMKKLAGVEGLAELGDVMGIAGDGVEHYLAGQVERQVEKAKILADAAAAKATAPAPAVSASATVNAAPAVSPLP